LPVFGGCEYNRVHVHYVQVISIEYVEWQWLSIQGFLCLQFSTFNDWNVPYCCQVGAILLKWGARVDMQLYVSYNSRNVTSSTFTSQTQSLKKSVTYAADDNCGVWHLRCSWMLILFSRVRLWMCSIISHFCSYGEVSGNGWICHPTWCTWQTLSKTVLKVGVGSFTATSHFSWPQSTILWSDSETAWETIFKKGEHFNSSLAQGGTSNDDGVYLLFHHWQQTIDSLKDYFSDRSLYN